MIIHLVRHAEAIERSMDVLEDHRFLTRRGRKRFRKVTKSLKKLGLDPDVILTSPMIRAVQTAEILAEGLRHDGELQVAPTLGHGFRPKALDQLLGSYPQAKEIALVGHEPEFGMLAKTLLKSETDCTMSKGAVLSLKRSDTAHGDVEFVQLVTGGGKIITSRSKALDRLTGQAEDRKQSGQKVI
jgi:phosphohistidine phosphatase